MQDLIRANPATDRNPAVVPGGRLMVRLVAEMQLSLIAGGMRALNGDLDRAVVFMVVARASELLSPHGVGHAHQDGGSAKAISINALAASLGRPFETMRRHIHALCAMGLCIRGPAGVSVPEAVHTRPEIVALFRSNHDAVVRMAEDFARFGLSLPETRRHPGYDWHSGLAAAHDVLLTGIEFHSHRFQSWTDMALINAILCANARPLLEDRDLATIYADFEVTPPESLWRPVSTGAIARALGLAASTAHRRVSAMVDAGLLVRRARGVMLAPAALAHPAAMDDSRTAMLHTRQILIRLAAGGFRFDQPDAHYLDGRAPLLQFG
ncbi:helix-turn-helix domain-containing protein [Sphingomonas elodea]|uniref:helix-turn-helix domain-containing protein n=1 Tax=Sphingomonas elodea TaxID=179878 RepID=UPI000263090F|nr:helix-turn-helix domain-containing protein [Sphingomonas elodea]